MTLTSSKVLSRGSLLASIVGVFLMMVMSGQAASVDAPAAADNAAKAHRGPGSSDLWEHSLISDPVEAVWEPADRAAFFGHPSLAEAPLTLASYSAFLSDCGFISRKLELRYDAFEGYNIYLTAAVNDTEPLLSMPGECFLYPFNPNLHATTKAVVTRINELFWGPGVEYTLKDFARVVAILTLASEKVAPSSKWRAYIDSLPTANLPYTLTDEEVEPALVDRPRETSIAFNPRRRLRQDLRAVIAADPSAFAHITAALETDPDLLDWCTAVVTSRTFAWGTQQHYYSMTLVPGIDMINHDNDIPNNYHYTTSHEMAFVPGKPAQAGEPIAISYHPNYPNPPLFADYGFVLRRNTRDHVFLSLTPAVLAHARTLPAADVAALLSEYPVYEPEALHTVKPHDDDTDADSDSSDSETDSESALPTLSFFAIASYDDHIPPALLASVSVGAFASLDGPSLAAYGHVLDVLRSALADYTTSLACDDARLTATPATAPSVLRSACPELVPSNATAEEAAAFAPAPLTANQRLLVSYAAEAKRLVTDLLLTTESDRRAFATALADALEELVRPYAPLRAALSSRVLAAGVRAVPPYTVAEAAAEAELHARTADPETLPLLQAQVDAAYAAHPDLRRSVRARVVELMGDRWAARPRQSFDDVSGEDPLRTIAIPLARRVSKKLARTRPGVDCDAEAYAGVPDPEGEAEEAAEEEEKATAAAEAAAEAAAAVTAAVADKDEL